MDEQQEQIKEVLTRDLPESAPISEQQVSEVAERISGMPQVDKETVETIANEVAGSYGQELAASIDLGDINSILGGDKKPQI